MEITTHPNENRIALVGEAGPESSKDVYAALSEFLSSSDPVLVDLSQCDRLSVGVIQVIASFMIGPCIGELILQGLSKENADILEELGMARVIGISKEEEAHAEG